MRKRLVVLTIATNGLDQLYRPCIQTHAAYATRHGYWHLFISDFGRSLSANESAWMRIPIMRILVESGPVFYVDADAEFRPAAPPIELVDIPGKAVYMAYGISRRFNSGVVYLSQPDAGAYLDEMLANYNTPIPKADRAPYENGHFIHFARKYSDVVHRLDDRWNNTMSEEMDDYIRHYTNSLRHLRPGHDKSIWAHFSLTAKWLLSSGAKQTRDETAPARLTSLAAGVIAAHPHLTCP